jgi:hypothetical protein
VLQTSKSARMANVKMHKKAAENALSTLIEIIFFVALFLLIALPIIQKYLGVMGPTTGEKKALDSLTIEINNWEDGKEGSVPIYLENYIIKGLKKSDKKPALCKEKEKACLCLCKTRSCDEKNDEVRECRSIDFDLMENYVIFPYLVEEEAKTTSCIIKRIEQEIAITKCAAT